MDDSTIVPPVKRCSRCSDLKPLDQFNRSKKSKSGYRYECRDCQMARNTTMRNRMHIDVPALKTCCHCNHVKPSIAFSPNLTAKDGLTSRCKECINLWGKERTQAEKIQVNEKLCPRCKIIKPTSKFWKDMRKRDGIAAYCIDCNNAYYASNAEKLAKLPSEKWCNACQQVLPASAFTLARKRAKGLSTHCRECVRFWRDSTKEMRREYNRMYSRNYYWANKAKVSLKHRLWSQRNPNIKRAIRHRRVSRIAGNGGFFTIQELFDLQVKQNGICAYCQRWYPALTIDHIIPTTQGGTSNIENIALACRSCNSSKKDRTPEQWVDRWYLR